MEVVINIYEGMTKLDAIGPYEVLRNLRACKVKFVAREKGEIIADSKAVHLLAKYDIDEIKRADILLIPGSTIAFMRELQDEKVLQWIRDIDKTTLKTVTVCTGSIILAATGLLEGKKATSHWKPIQLLKEFGAIPSRERIVEEGKFISAAGVSAGIDMALYLAAQVKGEKEAKVAQLAIEYDPQPIFQSGNYLKADPDIIQHAEKLLERDAIRELSLWEMLKNTKRLLKLKLKTQG